MNGIPPPVRIKRIHPDAVIPTYATDGAACFDLCAVGVNDISVAEAAALAKHGHGDECVVSLDYDGAKATFRTGLKFEIPPGWCMEIYSRSGHGFKDGVRLVNSVAVIDSDFRGEVLVGLISDSPHPARFKNGDRIAQAKLVPAPRVSFVEVTELSSTERGEGGFGSTGQ